VDASRVKRRGDEVLVDVAHLGHRNGHYWESYYGSRGRFVGDPDEQPLDARNYPLQKRPSDYGEVFASPYFDYRRTHSRVNALKSLEIQLQCESHISGEWQTEELFDDDHQQAKGRRQVSLLLFPSGQSFCHDLSRQRGRSRPGLPRMVPFRRQEVVEMTEIEKCN